jgi:hypothetical protein
MTLPMNSIIFRENIKTGTFDQSELFDPKLTRHFLQYTRHAQARTHQQQLA